MAMHLSVTRARLYTILAKNSSTVLHRLENAVNASTLCPLLFRKSKAIGTFLAPGHTPATMSSPSTEQYTRPQRYALAARNELTFSPSARSGDARSASSGGVGGDFTGCREGTQLRQRGHTATVLSRGAPT